MIQLISNNNEIVSCDKKLLSFSEILNDLNPDEEIKICFSTQVIQQIEQFYQFFDFDQENFKDPIFSNKVCSPLLKDNLNKKSHEFLKNIGCIMNENEINCEIIKDLIDATYLYQFKELNKVLLKAIATDLYCNDTEEDIENFKKKHKLNEISPEEQLSIMKNEFKTTFDQFNEKAIQQLYKFEPNLFN